MKKPDYAEFHPHPLSSTGYNHAAGDGGPVPSAM